MMGVFNTTFGINGEVNVVSLGLDTDWGFLESVFSKIIIQPDGKIIAEGNSFDGKYFDLILSKRSEISDVGNIYTSIFRHNPNRLLSV